jgi:hypothetical protein
VRKKIPHIRTQSAQMISWRRTHILRETKMHLTEEVRPFVASNTAPLPFLYCTATVPNGKTKSQLRGTYDIIPYSTGHKNYLNCDNFTTFPILAWGRPCFTVMLSSTPTARSIHLVQVSNLKNCSFCILSSVIFALS